jgi:hypothetical protein
LENHLHKLVRLSLFVRHSLDIGVHRDLEIGMTYEFLNDFGVLSIGIQDRPKGVTKRMPASFGLLAPHLTTHEPWNEFGMK